MKYITIFFLVLFFACQSQEKKDYLKQSLSHFPKKKTEVLLLGTFHFSYPERDVVKTDKNNRIDILKEPKKSELNELIEQLKQFNPNKIAIEAPSTWLSKEIIKNFKAGKYDTLRSESVQIGVRLCSELKLDTFYGIDEASMKLDLLKLDSNLVDSLFKEYDFQHSDPYLKDFLVWKKFTDSLVSKIPLIDYFKLINSETYHEYAYGVYLVGDFKLDNHRGADVLSTWWYNRNLRIFRNIQDIDAKPEDRILVVIGNGHAAVLRQLINCSPEYKLIELDTILN